jgi:aminoglycoside phosphotransferase (APT) family kinase protein
VRFRKVVPRVIALRDRLASYGVAETVQHDDLHDAQIFVRNGRAQVLDWGDACISHPFFTLAVSLEGVLQWGLHEWRTPWTWPRSATATSHPSRRRTPTDVTSRAAGRGT